MTNFSEQNIEELQKTIASGMLGKFVEPKAIAILSSKSIGKLAANIHALDQNIVIQSMSVITKVEELNSSLQEMIRSSNKMYKATVAFSIIMAILTCAIAFSALSQAGVF